MKSTESALKKLIEREIAEYLKEMSTMASGAVEGSLGPVKGGDDDEESEYTTQPIIRRVKNNGRN